MSYIPDLKIMELTKQINDARELFEQVVAERDKLKAELAAARARLQCYYHCPACNQPQPFAVIVDAIDAALAAAP